MTRNRFAFLLSLVAMVFLLCVPAFAEDKTGKWEVSVGFYMQETTSYETGQFPRSERQLIPDDFAAYDINDKWGVETEAFSEIGVTYHFKPWLDFELNFGQFEASVGQINRLDLTNRIWGMATDESNIGGNGGATVLTFDALNVGTVEQRQFMVGAKFRFNADSRWNPYIGIGIGNMNSDLALDSDMVALANFLANSEEYAWTREHFDPNLSADPLINLVNNPNMILEGADDGTCRASGAGFCATGIPGLMSVTHDGGFVWQLRAGLEYQLGPNVTFFGEAKYNFVSGDIEIAFNGEKNFVGVENGDMVIGWAYDCLPPSDPGPACGSNISTGRGVYIVNGGQVGQDNLQVGGGMRWTF